MRGGGGRRGAAKLTPRDKGGGGARAAADLKIAEAAEVRRRGMVPRRRKVRTVDGDGRGTSQRRVWRRGGGDGRRRFRVKVGERNGGAARSTVGVIHRERDGAGGGGGRAHSSRETEIWAAWTPTSPKKHRSAVPKLSPLTTRACRRRAEDGATAETLAGRSASNVMFNTSAERTPPISTEKASVRRVGATGE